MIAMATITADLNDIDDLLLAQQVIEQRLGTLAPPPDAPPETGAAASMSPETATAVAEELWRRVGTESTRALLRAFAAHDEPVTLQQLADELGEDYATVRQRKFRLGRTERRVNADFGVQILPGTWEGTQNRYEMQEPLRRAIRALDD